jgi:hypothetical protein
MRQARIRYAFDGRLDMMSQGFAMLRYHRLVLVICVTLAHSSLCLAQDGAETGSASGGETPSLLSYGFKGLWLGAELGLSVGFLSTGSAVEEGEWKKFVFGAGLGALTGVAAGVVLAMIDTGTPPPATGLYVLRDAGYGTLLGALSGAAVGALFVLDSGEPLDIFTGASIGSLVGCGVGVVFGLIEANAEKRNGAAYSRGEPREPGVEFTLRIAPGLTPGSGTTIAPTVFGKF